MNPHLLLSATEHRPYALPARPWAMTQTWSDLLFAHWPVAPQRLRAFVPEPLEIDIFEGTAWIGVVPFRMTNVFPRGLLAVPYLSSFLELNVRTYVTFQGKSGVFFFSLDASNPLAVLMARKTFFLPYFWAAMTCSTSGASVEYTCRRTDRASQSIVFDATYRPSGPVQHSRPDSLEYFLTERYCLYVPNKNGELYRADIHHMQWPLQNAEAEIRSNTMTQPLGLSFADTRPLLHFAKKIETLEWSPKISLE